MTVNDTGTDTGTPVAAPMRRSLRILLIASLAFNMLIVGIGAGALISGRMADGPRRGIDLSLGPLVEALDESDRRAIMRSLRDAPHVRRPSRDARRADLGAVVAALRTDPFDPAAVAAPLDAARSRALGVMGAGQEALIARITAMTPQQRQAFADRLETGLARDTDRR